MAYAYIITPAGPNLKTQLTLAFLKRKQAEYEALQKRSRRWKRVWAGEIGGRQRPDNGI